MHNEIIIIVIILDCIFSASKSIDVKYRYFIGKKGSIFSIFFYSFILIDIHFSKLTFTQFTQ